MFPKHSFFPVLCLCSHIYTWLLVFPGQPVLCCNFRDPSLKQRSPGGEGVHTAERHLPDLMAQWGTESPWLSEISLNRDGHLCSLHCSTKFIPGGASPFIQLSGKVGRPVSNQGTKEQLFRDTLDEHCHTVIAPWCYIAAKHGASHASSRATCARGGRSCPLRGNDKQCLVVGVYELHHQGLWEVPVLSHIPTSALNQQNLGPRLSSLYLFRMNMVDLES